MFGVYELFRSSFYRCIAKELSGLTRYCDAVVDYRPTFSTTSNTLLPLIDGRNKTTVSGNEPLPATLAASECRSVVLLNGCFNHSSDIEALLQRLHTAVGRACRILVVAYNPYFAPLFRWLTRLGLRRGEIPSTFVTETALRNLAKLSGFEVLTIHPMGLFPFWCGGLGPKIDNFLSLFPRILSYLAPVTLLCLRPIVREKTLPTLTVVIPARNERGNIENAIRRLPDLGCKIEVLFIEGHSTDGTWEEIQRIMPLYESEQLKLRAFRQSGKGKGDAVRLGFAHASGELLTILDADLTMPPELLHRFYDAYCAGLGDFINGSRLVYPMEGDAMRPLNRLGNIFFAKALSRILNTPLSDSLCGTKLFARHDYERFCRWRLDFGDFDPFGDFELLFPAASLGLGVIDVPIHYRARSYGTTNILRFRHGWMLLKMTLFGFFRIRLGMS